MIEFHDSPFAKTSALITIGCGATLDDALAQFGQREDCIGCSTSTAAPPWTSEATIERVLATISPIAAHGPIVRPGSTAGDLLRRRSYWVDVDIDAGAQRLRTVKMPAALTGAQRLVVVSDLRTTKELRPIVALGLWTLFAHPLVRTGALLAGQRDGLAAEIALAVHPDHYVLIEQDRINRLVIVIDTADPIAADLIVLALRQGRSRVRGAGPWEDPLVQAATELDLGIRNYEQISISAIVSAALSPDQQRAAATMLRAAAEAIGVRADR